MAKPRSGLGKGLAALIQENPDITLENSGFLPTVPIDDIEPNPKQPRAQIKPDELIGLADSIREHGILEPLIVTEIKDEQRQPTGKYMLVAGERRWRAAKLAQLDSVPVLVKDISPQQVLEIAIIENIQRKDLNSIEEATALSELYHNYRIKLEDLAKKVGKDISTISNKMRLLKLPDPVQTGMLNDEITESHAYALLALKNQDAILAAYNIISKQKSSVRQTEELVRKINLANKDVTPPSKRNNAIVYDEKTEKIDHDLNAILGKGYRLIRKKNGGRITIPFMNDDQLDALYTFLKSQQFLDSTDKKKA